MALVMPDGFTFYCDADDVARVYSLQGVQLHLDDDQDGAVSTSELEALTFARGDATETINAYCMAKHTAAWLATSFWVRSRASWLAAMAVGQRRGNDCPEGILDRCERIIEEFENIRDGSGVVPGLPRSFDGAPGMSNVRCDPRFIFKVLRVERHLSTRRKSPVPQTPDYEALYLSNEI